MNALVPFVSGFLSANPPISHKRCFANIAVFLGVVGAYTLGCVALYNYLLPQWGDFETLLVLGGVLLATSAVISFLAWVAKRAKTTPLTKANTAMETALAKVTEAPLPVAALLALVGIAFYAASARSRTH